MLIEYIELSGLVKVTSQEISDMVDNIGDYTTIRVSSTLNCGTDTTKEYDTTEVLNTSNTDYHLSVADKAIYIKSDMFGLTLIEDGIYKVNVRLLTLDNATIIENCNFIDITYKCKVASLLQNIINENQEDADGIEKPSTIAHILHYALINGSGCGCNCNELCSVFNSLKEILDEVDPQIANDCGC